MKNWIKTVVSNEINETFLKCLHCDFSDVKANIEVHMITHHGVVVICGECGEVFDEQEICEEHMKTEHETNQTNEPIPCKSVELF